MIGNLSLVQYQYISLIIFSALALVLIVLSVLLYNRFAIKRFIKTNKQLAYMNMDDDTSDCTIEGISLLAKRKYLVSNENKVKPQVYTLVATDNTIICINHVNRELCEGDTIELKDGDTICSLKENVVLAA